jgi:hypothetical protein
MIEYLTIGISVVALIVSTWAYIDTRNTYEKIKRRYND